MSLEYGGIPDICFNFKTLLIFNETTFLGSTEIIKLADSTISDFSGTQTQ